MDVRLPDGTVIRGVPDGMSRADLTAKLARNGYDVSTLTPKQEAAPNPTDGMSTFDTAAAGLGKGVVDVGRGLKQRLDEAAAGLESMVPGGQAMGRFFGGKSAADIRNQGQADILESKRLDAPLMGKPSAIAGNIAGNALAGSMTAALGPVGMGAAMGFATPTTNGPTEVLGNMALGAGTSYVGDKAVKGLSRMLKPEVRPDVRKLIDSGVDLTPGQIMGGNFAKAEAKSTSLPIIGDAIANAQRRGGDQLNRVAFNRALSPIGEKLPISVSAGRDAVKYVDDTLGAAYEKLLPKLTTQADDVFVSDVQRLRQMVQDGALDEKYTKLFERTVQSRVLDKFQGQSAMTGQTLKDTESFLTTQIKRFAVSQDPDARLIGDAMQELQSSLRGLVQRSNPAHAQELKAINTGWANFKRVQRAAGYMGAEDGVFTPAQLQSAVKALDRSKDKARFAEGRALMQDLSDSAKSVMGSKYPDSGTAGRAMNAGAIASGLYNPAIPLSLGAGAAAYSVPMQKALQSLLTSRPEALQLLGSNVRQLAPLGGLLGASTTLSNQ